MAYICKKPKGYCPQCPHYRPDEDYPNRMACWAVYDQRNKIIPQ